MGVGSGVSSGVGAGVGFGRGLSVGSSVGSLVGSVYYISMINCKLMPKEYGEDYQHPHTPNPMNLTAAIDPSTPFIFTFRGLRSRAFRRIIGFFVFIIRPIVVVPLLVLRGLRSRAFRGIIGFFVFFIIRPIVAVPLPPATLIVPIAVLPAILLPLLGGIGATAIAIAIAVLPPPTILLIPLVLVLLFKGTGSSHYYSRSIIDLGQQRRRKLGSRRQMQAEEGQEEDGRASTGTGGGGGRHCTAEVLLVNKAESSGATGITAPPLGSNVSLITVLVHSSASTGAAAAEGSALAAMHIDQAK